MAATRLTKGGTLAASPHNLSVLSYNLLAPAYVRPIDKRTGAVQAFAAFEWCSDAAVDWDTRRPKLRDELERAGADEVQFVPDGDGGFALPGWLGLDRYRARVPAQSALQAMAARNERVLGVPVPVGNAILYLQDRLEPCGEVGARAAADGPSPPDDAKLDEGNTTTRVLAGLRGKRGGPLEPMSPIAVVSLHLDATSEEKRVGQLAACLKKARECGLREMVIAGDLNTEVLPGSCVGAFLADAAEPTAAELATECAAALRLEGGAVPTAKQLTGWRELRDKAAASAAARPRVELRRVPTGKTRAGWDHGADAGPCVAWALDHIFYTGRSLTLETYWSTLDDDAAAAAAGLPCEHCPSDHLPVAASFAPAEVPALGAEGTAALAEAVDELDRRQSAATAADAAGLPPPPPGAEPGVKSRGRPPPEVIEYRRAVRERGKRLKQRLQVERAAFVDGLSELERDALFDGIRTDQWLQQGKPR